MQQRVPNFYRNDVFMAVNAYIQYNLHNIIVSARCVPLTVCQAAGVTLINKFGRAGRRDYTTFEWHSIICGNVSHEASGV